MIRLAKYIADAGHCSRRAACRLIETGDVEVNDRIARHADRVSSNDKVIVQGQEIRAPERFIYYLYNKPVGMDCVCNVADPASIVHFMPSGEGIPRLFPVGRLDKDSHGLMLLTNHGDLCHRMLHPNFYHEKEYLVTLNRPFDDVFINGMMSGVRYGDVVTKPCIIKPVTKDQFRILLTQGLNRQIRRMCGALGYRVIDLQRIRLLDLKLQDLPLSVSRLLTGEEIQTLPLLISSLD